MTYTLEYIWLGGNYNLRSKTKVIGGSIEKVEDLPRWGFDGSSTNQAEGENSDCMLKPVYMVPDPIRGDNSLLVMCEVLNADGTIHASNTRSKLATLDKELKGEEAWFGIEQEYTLFEGRSPLGWPEGGYPAPQGPFYCGVGADEVFGREIVEEHLELCIEAGLEISGINAEVMPGQWEYQIGPVEGISAGDQVWISRYIFPIPIFLSGGIFNALWPAFGYFLTKIRSIGNFKVWHLYLSYQSSHCHLCYCNGTTRQTCDCRFRPENVVYICLQQFHLCVAYISLN